MGSFICHIILVHAPIIDRETSCKAIVKIVETVVMQENLGIVWQGMVLLFLF